MENLFTYDKKATDSLKKSKHKVSLKTKILTAVGLVSGLVFGYFAYAYIVSNVIEECIPANDYCRGIFPFERGTFPFERESECLMRSEDGSCLMYEVAKPIIYLYPEKDTLVSVKLDNPDLITTSYPKYVDGWEVLAHPDGTLIDMETKRELYSLYWEGKDCDYGMTNEGFIVEGSNTAEFLEEKLAILGLNARESEEFIIYWLPKMQDNKYNYIRFASMDEINNYMPLDVNPQPDAVIRVLMLYKPLENPIDINEQKLDSAPTRDGFTLVEWGGSQVK